MAKGKCKTCHLRGKVCAGKGDCPKGINGPIIPNHNNSDFRSQKTPKGEK